MRQVRLGSILRRQGQIKQSVSVYSRALKILRELLGDSSGGGGGGRCKVLVAQAKRCVVELLAKTLNNIGEALLALGRLDAAMLRLEEARAIKEKLYGKESVEVAATLDNLGLVYSRMGNLTLALACCGAAQKTRDVLLGRVHRESAKSRLNLAAVLLQLSDHDGAMRVWGEAVEIFSELGETSMEVAKAFNNMATVEQERGRDREVLTLLALLVQKYKHGRRRRWGRARARPRGISIYILSLLAVLVLQTYKY
jgi:tetratricopeptide (TPR) repeat protein